MNDPRREDNLASLLDDHVTGADLQHRSVTAEESELLDIADLLWEAEQGAPPLNQDPVAAMLGLVPDNRRSLDADALKKALQSAGVQVSELARRLGLRGWDVTTRDVFNWQTKSNASVPPALIQAISEILGKPADSLTVDLGESPNHRVVRSVTSSEAFQALAERWARLRHTTQALGASALESKLATSVYRGDDPDEAQMLASLEELVSALESETPGDEGR
jgi:transcriptional regulator with XRE-family HTH domain